MPIHFSNAIRNLPQAEFDECDYVVMRCAFDSQNSLGRMCDERVYENDLARRLRAAGFVSVETQVPITVSHGDFSKTYRIDLIADEAVYELKTVSALVDEHTAQVLNYAMLLSVNHIKLLNFRNSRVEGKLKYNAVLTAARFRLKFDEKRWTAVTPQCISLKQYLIELLRDWGGFLDYRLYEEALVHFFGGELQAKTRVPIVSDGFELGTHQFCCLGKTVCFVVSGLADVELQKSHFQKLLRLTQFEAMQWVNFHHELLTLTTLTQSQ